VISVFWFGGLETKVKSTYMTYIHTYMGALVGFGRLALVGFGRIWLAEQNPFFFFIVALASRLCILGGPRRVVPWGHY
jgi:hypothetical protein